MKNENPNNEPRTFSEQIEVSGNQLVDKVKELVEEGNVRRIVLRAPDDRVMLEMTFTVAAIGGALTLAVPWLAALGAIAALVTKMRIEVVREIPADGDQLTTIAEPDRPASTGKQKVKIEVED